MKVYFDYEDMFDTYVELDISFVPRIGETVVFRETEFIVRNVISFIDENRVVVILKDTIKKPIQEVSKTNDTSINFREVKKIADQSVKDISSLQNDVRSIRNDLKRYVKTKNKE